MSATQTYSNWQGHWAPAASNPPIRPPEQGGCPMSVILSTAGQVKPGRRKDFLTQQSQASQLNQRLGARPPRLLMATIAGEAYGSWTFGLEFEDLEAFATYADKAQA